MAYVTCVACNTNCSIPTSDDEVFIDDGDTYIASCWCPCAQCFVEFEDADLKKAHDEDEEDDW